MLIERKLPSRVTTPFLFFLGKSMIQRTRELRLSILMWVNQSRNQSTSVHPVQTTCPAQC